MVDKVIFVENGRSTIANTLSIGKQKVWRYQLMVNVDDGVYSCGYGDVGKFKFTHFYIKHAVIYYRDIIYTCLYLWVMQTYTGNSCY